MSIVGNIFRPMLPGLFDNLEAQGVLKSLEKATPNISTAEMFGGEQAARNIGKEFNVSPELLDQAAAEWKKLTPEEWAAKYNPQAINMDVNSGKAMFEFPDDAVQPLKGKDPLDKKQFPDNKDFGLNEIVKTDLLNKAYPEMEDIRVRFKSDPNNSGHNASFDPQDNILTINRDAEQVQKVGIVPSMLHEIQHYVQGKEMLTSGESFRLRLQDYPDFTVASRSLQKAIGSKALGLDMSKIAKDFEIPVEKVVMAFAGMGDNPGGSAKAQLIYNIGDQKKAEQILKNVDKFPAVKGFFEDKSMAKEAIDAAFSDYLNVAGEAFARSTADRRNLDMKARKELPASQMLDVPFNTLTPSKAQAVLASRQQQVVNPLESSITDTTLQQGL